MIIENDRDKRAAEWLESTFGAEAIVEAENALIGARKPFVSNVAKQLGVIIPDDVIRTPNAEARARLDEIRKLLAEKWCSISKMTKTQVR